MLLGYYASAIYCNYNDIWALLETGEPLMFSAPAVDAAAIGFTAHFGLRHARGGESIDARVVPRKAPTIFDVLK